VSRTEGIVLAFRAAGKARKTARLTERVELVAPARKQLVHVALMAHVKYYMILRRVKYAVKRNGKLHNPEIGGEMTARYGNPFNKEGAYLVRKLRHQRSIHTLEIVGRIYSV
jgi:hypothetical protein